MIAAVADVFHRQIRIKSVRMFQVIGSSSLGMAFSLAIVSVVSSSFLNYDLADQLGRIFWMFLARNDCSPGICIWLSVASGLCILRVIYGHRRPATWVSAETRPSVGARRVGGVV